MGHYTRQNSICIILTVFYPMSPLCCIVQIVIVLALLLALKTTHKPTVHYKTSPAAVFFICAPRFISQFYFFKSHCYLNVKHNVVPSVSDLLIIRE